MAALLPCNGEETAVHLRTMARLVGTTRRIGPSEGTTTDPNRDDKTAMAPVRKSASKEEEVDFKALTTAEALEVLNVRTLKQTLAFQRKLQRHVLHDTQPAASTTPVTHPQHALRSVISHAHVVHMLVCVCASSILLL